MTELILYMNNYSITGAITAYQTYPQFYSLREVVPNIQYYNPTRYHLAAIRVCKHWQL